MLDDPKPAAFRGNVCHCRNFHAALNAGQGHALAHQLMLNLLYPVHHFRARVADPDFVIKALFDDDINILVNR